MSAIKPYHFAYVPNEGMRAAVGDAGMVSTLEPIGSGLPSEGSWAAGGPVIWRPNGFETTFVGWIRGVSALDFQREGIWESWGVTIPDQSIKHLQLAPWLWSVLQQNPTRESLAKLVDRFTTGDMRGLQPPTYPSGLPEVLTELYAIEESGSPLPLHVPVPTRDATALLIWAWYFGPIDRLEASVGPPRRGIVAASPPLTYSGVVGAPIPNTDPTPFSNLLYGSPQTLERTLAELRMNPQKRRSLLNPVPATPEPTTNAVPVEEPSLEDGSSGTRFGARKVEIILLVISLLSILVLVQGWAIANRLAHGIATLRQDVATLRRDIAALQQTTRGSERSTTAQPSPTRPPRPVEMPPAPSAAPAPSVALAGRVREVVVKNRGTFTYSAGFARFAQKADVLKGPDADRLAVAALQMFYSSKGWYSEPIDGIPGRDFVTAIRRANGDPDLANASRDEFLLSWLQSL